MVTTNVDDETYEAFRQEAQKRSQSAAALIRQAMEEYRERHIVGSRTIFDSEPASVGTVLSELGPNENLLEELLH